MPHLAPVERDRCAPEDFYSTTNHKTHVRNGQQWIEVENQRMDAMIVVADGRAYCRRLRDLRAGDQIVVGLRGIRVTPESKERDRLSFAFMSNGISSERQVETAVRQTAALVRHAVEQKQKVLVVAGPVVVHTGGVAGLASLIRGGWVHGVLSGNALGVHDMEAALLGTSLGVRLSDGRQEEHGHRNHMRAINAIYHAGSVRQAVESGRLTPGDPLRMREGGRAVRAGRQPARRRPAARHHHRHERRAGRLRRAVEGRRPGALPGLDAALHRHRQHAAELGENRVRGYQSRRWRPRSATAAPARRWALWPTSACSSICSRKLLA